MRVFWKVERKDYESPKIQNEARRKTKVSSSLKRLSGRILIFEWTGQNQFTDCRCMPLILPNKTIKRIFLWEIFARWGVHRNTKVRALLKSLLTHRNILFEEPNL